MQQQRWMRRVCDNRYFAFDKLSFDGGGFVEVAYAEVLNAAGKAPRRPAPVLREQFEAPPFGDQGLSPFTDQALDPRVQMQVRASGGAMDMGNNPIDYVTQVDQVLNEDALQFDLGNAGETGDGGGARFTAESLGQMTRSELAEQARAIGLELSPSMRKEQMVEALLLALG